MDILSKYKETIQSIFCKNLLELPEAEYIRHTQQMQGDKYRVFVIGFAGTAGMYSCNATGIIYGIPTPVAALMPCHGALPYPESMSEHHNSPLERVVIMVRMTVLAYRSVQKKSLSECLKYTCVKGNLIC